MKRFFTVLFVFFYSFANATTYYISASGDDANNGLSASTPWKTISKLNSVFSTLSPGDFILFKKGDSFYGNVVINKSGIGGSPITISNYGSGINPLITGFTYPTAWTNLGGNIWESITTVSTLSGCNIVSINGSNTPVGRIPNYPAYYTYSNPGSTASYIVCPTLNSAITNWTGATAVIRKYISVSDQCIITSHNGSILYNTDLIGRGVPDGYGNGFFIQNDIKTLDIQNEWYFNPATHKIRIYNTSMPVNVNVASISNIISNNGFDYITIDGLQLTGANHDLISNNGSTDHIFVKNCNLAFAGNDAIELAGGTRSIFTNNIINDCGKAGIFTSVGTYNTISHNYIRNCGVIEGQADDGVQTDCIFSACFGDSILYNDLKGSGSNGIIAKGTSFVIQYNLIDSSNIINSDNGGIYTAGVGISRLIDHNIVLHTVGLLRGTNRCCAVSSNLSEGIYLDEGCTNTVVTNNTSAFNGANGIKLHSRTGTGGINSNNNRFEYNTLYGNPLNQFKVQNDNSALQMMSDTIRYNLFFAQTYDGANNAFTFFLDDQHNTPASLGIINFNGNIRPLQNTNYIIVQQNVSGNSPRYTATSFHTAYPGYEINGYSTPKITTNITDLRFEYNASSLSKIVSLDANYIDAKNISYNGSITLAPYTSAVLIKNGPILINKLPKANAGIDQTIPLPTSLALLIGSGSDSDGTISSYNWKKISGPAAGSITDTTAASTIAKPLVQGVYKFVLIVTDNLGGIGKDTMQVTVNPAPNVPPLVNAGSDQTITLPTNTANLSGGATDPDGTIASYSWSKIAGPSASTIANASSFITTVTGLIQGTYKFELKATDNSGTSTRDTMQIIVNSAPNVLPVANAGLAQTITLPTSTVTLSGGGTDADGTIVSYNWTKISGPSTYSIVNTSLPGAIITGLSAGIYQFQLLVTDNSGGTGTDIVQVTVKPAINIPPVANAGVAQSINLPTNSVTLSGSGTDADGTVIAYQWVEISGPSAYTIVSAASAITNITGMAQGTYQFQLTVTDNSNATSIAIVQIVVNAVTNVPPVVNAGTDQTITLPTNSITLSGSGTDADGTIATYAWTKISGPSAYNIVSPSSPFTNVSGLLKGTYQFQLSVTDNSGAVSTDIIQIKVNAGANIPPVSNAGPDQTLTLPLNTATLAGSGTDADGTIVSYLWTEVSGPSVYSISNASSALTTVSGLVQGTYLFNLIVTDNAGATANDIMQIVVNGSINILPVANAGAGQNITLPTNTVTLSGSGTDADGSVTAYQWTVISGPSTYNILNPSLATTNVTGLAEGVYQFQLLVTDNNGATSTDVTQVTVNAAANIPPVANAGTNATIILPANTITLSGSGTDADGTVVSYQWAEISGPSSFNITNASAATTDVTGLSAGTYQFQLLVTDNNGATANSIVQVTVIAPANIPPVANAGIDQTITLPASTITLQGSGNDADGTIVSYFWTATSGPAAYTITNPLSAVANVTGLVKGTYKFQLIVTDNSGATSSAFVQVTVNAIANIAPAADAGADEAITLPVNTVTLLGNGNDPDGTIVSYQWAQLSGPASSNISNAASPTTDVTGLTAGVYQFQLMVTDNNGATGNAIVQITVNAADNIPPVADAGSDQSIILPTNIVTLPGSGSDADGTIASYFWTATSGPATFNITNPSSAVTDVTGLVSGTYVFQLVVTDNNGATSAASVQVIVNAANNIPPIANAGTGGSITLPTNSINVSGSGTDADGVIVSYAWSQISGPAVAGIADASLANNTITGLVQGIYQFALTVTDNAGTTNSDTMQVIVNAGNTPPVANAGIDQTIILPANTIALSGTGTDADGTVVGVAWAKIAGPLAYNITDASSATTNITGLAQGVYQFTLTVTDDGGATNIDTMQVIVNPAANIAPVANAGTDETITLPANTINLSGSGTDADGTITNYTWTAISGPSAYIITDASAAATTVTGLVQGIYQFQLQVTDNSGAIATATIQVTVNAAVNIAPVADAGADETITLPLNNISLAGMGTDDDGTVVNYAWTKISGPSAYTITSATSASTTITGLTQGVYKFRLKVTDNTGATATDIVQVTVNTAANIPPVADAVSDQTITLPINIINLSGNGSDADGTIVSYAWAKISGPSSYNINSATSANTSITGLVQGVYQFQLKVTDNNGATATANTVVTVNAAANIAPVADAGADKTITLPVNSVSLSGNGTDADGTIASYAWTVVSGPSFYTITASAAAATTVTGLVQGVYQFQLSVTDNSGATSTAIMQVTVNAATNIAPVANAGVNQAITLPVNTIALAGSGTDADGTIANYLWTKISGPSSYNIISSTLPNTNITGLMQGVYQFQLKVTDNSGATATSIVHITVNAADNVAPVANAGIDQTITLPVNTITLAGTGTDADGTIATYSWTEVSGPSSYTITSTTSASTTITGLVQGVYQFQLLVTDNSGASVTDIIQVTVNAAINIPPVANAGLSKSVTLPANSVTLSGSGTDADGTITNYLWTKLSGPSSFTITSAAATTTTVTALTQGVYKFQLKVTDNSGATAVDLVQVTVNPAANIPPVANAGADQTIQLPVSSIALAASGTDADGIITTYRWTKISGPAGVTMVDPSLPNTDINGLTEGIYQFQLKVTDNSGATTTDVMWVTVNAAADIPPVAVAGANQSIALPTNTITLSGSATDADGTVVSYVWTKISGPVSAIIGNQSSAITNVTALTQGVYQFQLQVTDNSGVIATSITQVTVNAAPNLPPVANAGADKTIVLPTNTTNLSGIGTDADGTVTTYRWTKISGPSAYIITDGSSAATGITALTQGVYQFELKVTDNNGSIGTDVVQVTVKAAPNVPPIVSAGADKTITLPVNSVTLSGSASDADGTIASYIWTKITGPSSYTIQSITTASTGVAGLTAGVYQFELRVSDNSGAIVKDTVQVTVNPAPNVPPVANAGPSRIITLPVNTTSLAGSGTDADGTVTAYTWKKISGPAAGAIVNASSPVTSVTDLTEGVYIFQLKVIDNQGATSFDTMQVTVHKANLLPIANAGADETIVLPTNSIVLSGSGKDFDGTIKTYLWANISGPASTIVTANDSVTRVNDLTGGTYQFELTVTDNDGGTGKDTVTIVVAEPRLNLDPATANNSASVYPNPVTDITTLQINTTQAVTSVKYIIVNVQGRIITQATLSPGQSISKTTLDMSNYAKGMYIVMVYFDDKQKQAIKVLKL